MEPVTRWQRWKIILNIAWPLIVANSFWNLQLTIDRIMLGHSSTAALGAAMAVMGVFWVPMALLQQTAAYLMTFVAQFTGAKKPEMIGPAVWQSLYVSLAGGLLFLLLYPIAPDIFSFIGHSESMQLLEIGYFQSLCFSAMPTAIVAAASAFFTGLGFTRIIMVINCVGLIANVIFDYVLIFGKFGFPPMGIVGAGYATALANWVGAAYAIYIVFNRNNELKYKVISGWRFQSELMRRFLKYGLPSGLQWALEGLAFTVFLVFIGRMNQGDAALSSSGIVVTIMMLAVLPAMGVAQAVSVMVGQHLGEKRPQLAEAATWSGVQIAAVYIGFMAISFAVFPEFYLSWFHNAGDQELWQQVSQIVPVLLLFVALFVTFDSMNFMFSFALKGAGDTRFVTLVALTLPWPIMVLPTWLMKDFENSVYLAWFAASLFIITQSIVFLFRFRGGKWKSMSVID